MSRIQSVPVICTFTNQLHRTYLDHQSPVQFMCLILIIIIQLMETFPTLTRTSTIPQVELELIVLTPVSTPDAYWIFELRLWETATPTIRRMFQQSSLISQDNPHTLSTRSATWQLPDYHHWLSSRDSKRMFSGELFYPTSFYCGKYRSEDSNSVSTSQIYWLYSQRTSARTLSVQSDPPK